MAKESKTRFALLGILSLGPHSGYDIKQFVDQVLSFFWAESYGQIYPLLRQLEQEKLVKKRTEKQTGKPDRHVYSLTAAGHRALQHWLEQPPALPPARNELLLKLFFGNSASPSQLIEHVQATQAAGEQMLRVLQQTESELDTEADDSRLLYWTMTLRLGQRVTRARIEWCHETLKTLRALQRKQKG